MRLREVLPQALLFLTCLIPSTLAARKPSNSVLLSNVKTLTLRQGKDTTARRVASVPQLSCVGGNARGLYEVDVLRCTNSGADYDEDNVQWTCKASLPDEFKLGSTDVMCEGYDSPDDPYILKGSCGVEYRLVLTEAGEKKYGHRDDYEDGQGPASTRTEKMLFGLCLTFILGVFGYAIWETCTGRAAQRNAGGGAGRGDGGGGGWGRGDDGKNAPEVLKAAGYAATVERLPGEGFLDANQPDVDDDPPPPYTPRSQPKWMNSSRQSQVPGTQGWRPGFWTGAAAGAAGGYFAGNRGNSQRADPMVGSSRGAQRSSGSGYGTTSPSPSSSRYESTGFGGTQRR